VLTGWTSGRFDANSATKRASSVLVPSPKAKTSANNTSVASSFAALLGTLGEQEAFELFEYGMGQFEHVGYVLAEFQRGFRITASFSATGRPEDLAPTLALRDRVRLANLVALFAHSLGRIAEAWVPRQLVEAKPRKPLGNSYPLVPGPARAHRPCRRQRPDRASRQHPCLDSAHGRHGIHHRSPPTQRASLARRGRLAGRAW